MATHSHRFRWAFTERRLLGQVLIDFGLLDEDQLWEVLEQVSVSGELTGQVAVRLGYITQDQLREGLAEQRRLKLGSEE
jgi:hypothetical protein